MPAHLYEIIWRWFWNAPGISPKLPGLLGEAVEICPQRKGKESSSYLVSLHNYAGALIDSGDLNAAEATERQVSRCEKRSSDAIIPRFSMR